ncbi:MAG: CvpA family protein [Treponema sp.]|nr:CvpA family protein [Treponema sp.]
MNVLDYILIAILLIFTIRGFARGMINEVFGVASLVIPLFLSVLFYKKMGDVFAQSMNPLAAKILGFFAVFICSFVLLKIIQLLVKTVFSGPILKSLDKTLGLLLGFAEGGALVFLILVAMVEVNGTIDTSALREKSVVYSIVESVPA